MGIPFVSYDVGIIKEIVNYEYLGFVSDKETELASFLHADLKKSLYLRIKKQLLIINS